MDIKKAFSLIKSGDIDFVDLRFTDLRGVWQHMTVPAKEFSKDALSKGFGFDGSSIKGFQTIYESDMLLMPDKETLFKDPFFEKTLVCICDVFDPETGKNFEKDPRYTAKKAEMFLKKTKIGDISYWGPEIEFFVFERMYVHLDSYFSSIEIKHRELPNGEGRVNGEYDSYKIANKSGYFPVPPFDKLQAFRSEMVKILHEIDVPIEVHHHEVATGGQVEIDMKYDSLTKMADKVMIYKYVARNLAQKYGMSACFLPKPVYGDNGTGMHTHQSIFKRGENVFFDPKGYGEVSKEGLAYIAGLLSNVKAILGVTNSTVNSYRRLVPHFEAPTAISFSKRNRSAAVRIPMYYKKEEKSKRIEFRCPDAVGNPYLGFAAQLIFGIEGIEKKLDPKKMGFGPFDENIWENAKVEQTPNNLFETLEALAKDKILTTSGVFSPEIKRSYLELKLEEARQNLLYPTPADFYFYADI